MPNISYPFKKLVLVYNEPKPSDKMKFSVQKLLNTSHIKIIIIKIVVNHVLQPVRVV